MNCRFIIYFLLIGLTYFSNTALSASEASKSSLPLQHELPLGSLWYPGPYNPNATSPKPVKTPLSNPALKQRKIIPTIPTFPKTEPINASPQPGKPLGTLWYPGPYKPNVILDDIKHNKSEVERDSISKSQHQLTPEDRPYKSVKKPESSNSKVREYSGDFDSNIPVNFSADELIFNEKTGEIIAKGNVSIKSNGRQLEADSFSYDQKTEIVTAKGNIHFIQPDGEKIFAKEMKVTGDLKNAIIKGIGIILSDRSRIAASSAKRFNGKVTEMYNGVYSPCELCPKDPTEPPLWQVKAVKVIHDKNNKTIEYRDAWVEIMGFPVAYTPYLSHPDPSVRRKSGFLVPTFSGSSDLGSVGRVPYFFDLGKHRDATVTALVTGEGSGGLAEYRHRFRKGKVDTNGSIVIGDSKHDVRGHINSTVRFDIDSTWRWGLDFNRATDDTYLRRYDIVSENKFGSSSSLNSQIFAEGFRERNYFRANAYSFQGIQAGDDSDTDPLVLPLIDYNHLGRPDRFGGQTILDANLLAITREEGGKTRRFSFRPGWQIPFKDNLGGVYKLTANINADYYHVEDLQRKYLKEYNGFSGRTVPQVMLDWRFPVVKNESGITQVIEPVAVAIFSPYGGNSNEIPNEDSKSLEFDDTNLLRANKFSGIDRVEGGPRLAYGLKWNGFGENGGNAEIFLGQSARPKIDDTFAKGSGLEDKLSDLVGRVNISPGPYLNLLYRTRFDSDNFTPKRNEISLKAGGDALIVNTNYVFIEDQTDGQFGGREEIRSSINSKFTRFWRGAISGVHDIATGDSRQFIGKLTYENECLTFTTNASRNFFKDRDLEPTDQITFNVLLKTLGGFNSDIYQR
ncbi:MAG: LPS assembly protein LptD [Pseudomonadota bacterium]|nr:LPS assembly protein LptD [Pseudomonadota bacterium]